MQFAFDFGEPDVQVSRPVLASNTGREMCLAVAFQLALDGNQQVFRVQMRGEQFGLRGQPGPEAIQLGRLRAEVKRLRANRGGGMEVRLLDVHQLGLAVDAVPHVPAKRTVPQLAFSVEEQLFCSQMSHWFSEPLAETS